MKFRGGYNIMLEGRPGREVKRLPEPKELYMPLSSRRFSFIEVSVEQGQEVNEGDVLARDPDNFGIPLLAPRGGTVNLDKADGHIVLTGLSPRPGKVQIPEKNLPHIVKEMGTPPTKRQKLLDLGAWQFFSDAYTGQLPDPLGTPQAVIVSTVSTESFVVRGDIQLRNRLLQFTRGLEHLQSFLEYQPIYLIMPHISSSFAANVREHIRGYAWVKLIEIPLRYPHDNFNILARKLGLKKDAGPIWCVRTEGMLAIDRALTVSKPCLVRIMSIGGPGVITPAHLKIMAGYPIQSIIEKYASFPGARIIDGGILSGNVISPKILGIDTECRGLTVILEHQEREFLGFVRPGWNRHSYSECFLSSLRKEFVERLDTAIYGELRPCISCNYCDEVCPAGIMPHLIHKYLYRDLIEEVDEARVDLCIECGLCSFVCPSKIELRSQFIEAKQLIEKEKEEIRAEKMREEKMREEADSDQESPK